MRTPIEECTTKTLCVVAYAQGGEGTKVTFYPFSYCGVHVG